MECPNCNLQNPDDYKFCKTCGTKIPTVILEVPDRLKIPLGLLGALIGFFLGLALYLFSALLILLIIELLFPLPNQFSGFELISTSLISIFLFWVSGIVGAILVGRFSYRILSRWVWNLVSKQK